MVSSLKAHLKLCAKRAHRPLVLKDQIILLTLLQFLSDDPVVVAAYFVKMSLSEKGDDTLRLVLSMSNVKEFEESLALQLNAFSSKYAVQHSDWCLKYEICSG